MATLESVANAALLSLGIDDAHTFSAISWAQRRYNKLADRARLRHLRRSGQLVVPASVSSGLVSGALGAAQVTPDATALAAWQALGLPEGWFLRIGQEQVWYEVASFNGQSLLLTTPLMSVATDSAYTLVQRYLPLPKDLRHLPNEMTLARLGFPILVMSLPDLDALEPSRSIVSGTPRVVAEVSPRPRDGVRCVEVYPYAAQPEVLQYAYWRNPPELQDQDPLPPGLTAEVLIEGVKIDILEMLWSRAVAENEFERAGFYRNQAETLKTRWDRDEVVRALDVDSISNVSRIRVGRGFPGSYDHDPIRNGNAEWYRGVR